MKAQPLEWGDLRYVLAVGRDGTLSGAARVLGVNHSTVFRRIGAIEERLGVRLFERLPTGYALTQAGERMLETAEHVEEAVLDLSRTLVGGDLRLSGNLRVTAPDALAYRVLMPHLAAFRRAYPDIQLELSIVNSFLNLTRREADVAIRSTQTPPETAVGRRLCTLATTLYGSADYLRAHPDRSLERHQWLMPNEGLEQWPASKWLARHYPTASVVLYSDTVLGLFEAAKQGLGIAPLPCFLADPEQQLDRVLPPPPELDSELWLLSHPDLRRSARVRAFMDFLTEAVGLDRGLIEGQAQK